MTWERINQLTNGRVRRKEGRKEGRKQARKQGSKEARKQGRRKTPLPSVSFSFLRSSEYTIHSTSARTHVRRCRAERRRQGRPGTPPPPRARRPSEPCSAKRGAASAGHCHRWCWCWCWCCGCCPESMPGGQTIRWTASRVANRKELLLLLLLESAAWTASTTPTTTKRRTTLPLLRLQADTVPMVIWCCH